MKKLIVALALTNCGPTAVSMTDGGADVTIQACVRDERGCLPLGCESACTPGCFYEESGCAYLCNTNRVLLGTTCPDLAGRACTSGLYYSAGAGAPPSRESPDLLCSRLCIGGRLSPGLFDSRTGNLCR